MQAYIILIIVSSISCVKSCPHSNNSDIKSTSISSVLSLSYTMRREHYRIQNILHDIRRKFHISNAGKVQYPIP